MAREQRRLAAIVAADVVGYSRLMGRDESGTLARLREHRKQRFEPTLARHGGRLVKLTGDGALAAFPSAVDALNAAIEFQQSMVEADWNQSEDTRIVFRIGLHLGDLLVDGEDLYGDGVNVAARLEGEAPAGGIVISRTVHEAVEGRLKATFEDLGGLSLKNIERPVQAFRVQWEPEDWQTPSTSPVALSVTGQAADVPLSLPDKPSIAVLPFQNMSGDPEQEYFADGMVEDIITALSRFKSLFVIARNSSFAYKGKSPDIRQVGRDLGVRYVLEGSVRKATGRVRITGQLIDSQTGAHLWAERFDSTLENLFELQDEVTTRVVASVAPRVDRAEIERARRKPADNPDAYDCFLRATAKMYEMSRSSTDDALRLFHQAIRLDPDFATPYGMVARCHSYMWGLGWSADKAEVKAEVRRMASRVALIGHDDASALCAAGYALVRICEDDDAGVALIDQGLSVNPNLAIGWAHRGAVSIFMGDPDAAMEQLSRAMRLNPLDPEVYWTEVMISYVNLSRGRYDDALKYATQSLNHRPNNYAALWALAVANAMSGRIDEARKLMPCIRERHPDMRLSNLRDYIPARRTEEWAVMREGLRLAGLPE